MSEIAAASQEQSAGIEQVNQAITQMDDATQQNAALVEQAAAAAESLEEQVDALNQAVSVFKLDGSAYSGKANRPLRSNQSRVTPGLSSVPAGKHKQLAASSHAHGDEWETF
jgi:uncharacterized phage infection (PIP) family protein YhgE